MYTMILRWNENEKEELDYEDNGMLAQYTNTSGDSFIDGEIPELVSRRYKTLADAYKQGAILDPLCPVPPTRLMR